MTETKNILRSILSGDLKNKFWRLWSVPQNLEHHPEGNVLKHTMVCMDRACNTGNKNLIMAALFHDFGKFESLTFRLDNRMPVAYGHDKEGAFHVFKNRNVIREFGADPLTVFWIVKQHMRIKVFNEMKRSKRRRLENHPAFDLLIEFTNKIDGGGYE